jgi:quercetin dioxygenase-like cupin family protein
MHVATSELRAVSGGGLLLRFAVLGDVAWVVADIPAHGSADTSLEDPCVRSHWGIVLEGEVQLERADERLDLGPAMAFHLPAGGPPHRFRAAGAARIAGFEPVLPDTDVSEAGLRQLGFEPARQMGDAATGPAGFLSRDTGSALPNEGQVLARGVPMGALILTRATFGAKGGYATGPCHVPHWGLVTSGRLVLESAAGTEIIGPGDAYFCPPGPPGHRLLAADPASIVDFTPRDALRPDAQVADWRRGAFRAIGGRRPAARVRVAAL